MSTGVPKELRPEFDTAPHKAALRRAGVHWQTIDGMRQGSIVARGTLLLKQEEKAREALHWMEVAIKDAAATIGTPREFTDLEAISGAAATQALMELQGLRRGLEFTISSSDMESDAKEND